MPVAHLYAYYYIYMLGTGEEAQQPKQLKEQDQADEVLKANREQLQLTIKEIEKEMESLGNTFTFESSTLEARDKLAKIQVHCHVRMNQTTSLD